MSERKMVSVLAPIGVIGDRVSVLNYRCRSKDNPDGKWENGNVFGAELILSNKGQDTTYWWHYDVRLDRTSKPNIRCGTDFGSNPVFVSVGDDGIRKL